MQILTVTGNEKFKGRTLHAHQYRDSSGFEDKNVVIVGMGNSSLDIAAELARVAKSASYLLAFKTPLNLVFIQSSQLITNDNSNLFYLALGQNILI